MTKLSDRLSRDIAEALERIGEWGEVTIKKRNGSVSLLREMREQAIVDERTLGTQ